MGVSGNNEIVFEGVPVDLHGRVAAHVDALQRELEMILRDVPDAAADQVPAELRGRIQQLRDGFSYVSDHVNAAVASAHERGDATVDIQYRASSEEAGTAQELSTLLVDVDRYWRSGDLMTLDTPRDVLEFHDWFLTELVEQSEGRPPRRWSPEAGPSGAEALALGEDDDDVDETAGWDMSSEGSTVRISFTGDLDLVSAPHLRTLVAEAAQELDLSVLELDLSGVTFLDSVGLSVLLTVRMRLVNEVVTVTVVPSPAVERVFELAGVRQLFLADPVP